MQTSKENEKGREKKVVGKGTGRKEMKTNERMKENRGITFEFPFGVEPTGENYSIYGKSGNFEKTLAHCLNPGDV